MIYSKPFDNLKIVISSKSPNSERFCHEKIERYPEMDYPFAQPGFWKRNDNRLSDHKEVNRFMSDYWTEKFPIKQPKYHYFGKKKTRRILNVPRHTTRGREYELELENEMLKAKKRVDEKYRKQMEKDFENHFEDTLVKFIKYKETA